MKLAVSIALTVLVWHGAQWHAIPHQDRSGEWQKVSGPAPWLDGWVAYDSQMGQWELLEVGGWVPLHEGDTVIEDKGAVRIANL